MGCMNSSNHKKKENGANQQNSNMAILDKEPSSSTLKKGQSQTKEGAIDKLDDVNFNTTNLVSEKLGKITKDYTILNPALGKGAFGEVRKVIHKKTGQDRAVKIINKATTTKEEQEKLINEVNILKELDHPNIIKIFEFYQDDGFFYIVTELCTGGELFDKILEEKSFSEKKAADTFRQILSAVTYCHSHKIVHRDLKPENLLYESKKEGALIKVIDFGTSRTFDLNQKMNQKFGTPYYIAPEVLKKKYDEKCDIWSCGVILYILLCGFPPFNGDNDKEIMDRVAKGNYSFDFDEWKNISNEAKQFIKKMLEIDTSKRYSASQAMNDPWLVKFGNKNVVDIPLITKALTNMTTFRANQKLQEAIWLFLVNYLSTKEEKNELLKTFQALDLNGDGQISKEELIIGYGKIMNPVAAAEEANRIMVLVDKNNSGSIDYTEFVVATMNRENMLSKQKLDTAFKMFDKDGNGSISLDEIKEIFGGYGASIPDKVWKEIIGQVDENEDGQISYVEFKQMMQNLMNK